MPDTVSKPLNIGMLIFPKMTQLDFTGPYEVLAKMPDSKTHVIWKTLEPVAAETGLQIIPTTTLADCPPLDVIFVPGGPGQNLLMDDQEILDFLKRHGARAQWVTSVCTGSLLLAAAGLLTGYRAACHWASRDMLAIFDAIPDPARVVVDRNRITGGGVTAGIDFGFTVIAHLRGEDVAKRLQLVLEYAPQPPFNSGRPETADPALVADLQKRMSPLLDIRRKACEQAAARLKQA